MNLWVSKCYNQYNNRYFFLLIKIFLVKSYSRIVDNDDDRVGGNNFF